MEDFERLKKLLKDFGIDYKVSYISQDKEKYINIIRDGFPHECLLSFRFVDNEFVNLM